MSRRSRIPKFQVLTSQDSTTNPASAPTDISGVDSIVYHLVVDASVNAVLSVKVCNDLVYNASNLITLNFGQALTLVGGTDTEYMVRIENKGFKWMLLSVANNGGTGNIDAWITGTTVSA